MLGIWPIVAIWLFRSKPVNVAILWTLLGGHMLLPVKTVVDLPMIPPLGKTSIPSIMAYLGCRFIAGKRIPFWGSSGWVVILLLIFVIEPFITMELNQDAPFSGARRLQPMEHYDAVSAIINQTIFILPFFLGRQFFRSIDSQILLFRSIISAALVYSIFMIFEVRMSPQLHKWIYGYFPHSFYQQMRYGSFRPVVLMGHGLIVAFFTMLSVICASTFWQLKIKTRKFSPAGVTMYLALILGICKSYASIMYGLTGLFLVKFNPFKVQLLAARLLVLIALLYPTLSILNLFPHQALMDWMISIDPERASSMAFRFDNEHALLEHAKKRFVFGWGIWGRNRIYDPEFGNDITTTDGRWIITVGQFGLLGFIAEFGLIALPVFRAVSAFKTLSSNQEKILLSAHCLIVGLIIIDQLPNDSLAPWLWLVIGMLLGRSEEILAAAKQRKYQKIANNFAAHGL